MDRAGLEGAGRRLDLGAGGVTEVRISLPRALQRKIKLLADYRDEVLSETIAALLDETMASHADELRAAIGL